MNEAAAQICRLMPTMSTQRGKLFPLARQVVRDSRFGKICPLSSICEENSTLLSTSQFPNPMSLDINRDDSPSNFWRDNYIEAEPEWMLNPETLVTNKESKEMSDPFGSTWLVGAEEDIKTPRKKVKIKQEVEKEMEIPVKRNLRPRRRSKQII